MLGIHLTGRRKGKLNISCPINSATKLYIVTNQGSSLQNMEITGNTNPNGEPQRILGLLEKAVQSGAQNQKSNKVESLIKK